MTSSTWQALTTTGALANLSSGVRLRLSGPDADRYLNGQITNDVRKLSPGTALPACITNHKGKLEAFVQVTRDAVGALLISAGPEHREFLPLRLEKYLIADDCLLEEITESTALCHFVGPLGQLAGLSAEGDHLAAIDRFGLPGVDLWTSPDRLGWWLSRFPPLLPDDQSTLEVLHGIPAWDHELTTDVLPPEAGLDLTAIDYHKGCYIGQEVISRIRSVGRVNRSLTALVQTNGPPVEEGWTVYRSAPDSPPAPVGRLTRCANHPITGQRHALTFLRRGSSGPFDCGPDATAAAARLAIRKTLDD
jgi:tRNA-modifying protein YgfZ